MKTLLSATLFLLICQMAFGATTYTATVVIDDIYWKNHNEWESPFHAELYADGTLLQPSGAYYYGWWRRANGQGEFIFYPERSGYGFWQTYVDGFHDNYFDYRIEIILPTGEHIVSVAVRIGKYGTPQEVRLYARKENGNPLEGPNYGSIGLWTDYNWRLK